MGQGRVVNSKPNFIGLAMSLFSVEFFVCVGEVFLPPSINISRSFTFGSQERLISVDPSTWTEVQKGSISRPNRFSTSPRTHFLVFDSKGTKSHLPVFSSSELSFIVRNTINFINDNQVDTGLIQTRDVCMMQFACIATSKSRSPVLTPKLTRYVRHKLCSLIWDGTVNVNNRNQSAITFFVTHWFLD